MLSHATTVHESDFFHLLSFCLGLGYVTKCFRKFSSRPFFYCFLSAESKSYSKDGIMNWVSKDCMKLLICL